MAEGDSGTPAGEPPARSGSGDSRSRRPSIWERMRRGMADHNATAPSGPMGIPDAPTSSPDDPDAIGDEAAGGDDGPTTELVLERIHHYRDTIRSYQVLIEGQRVGLIRDSNTESFVLRPGSYTLRLQLLWIFSPKIVVELPEGGQTRMVCGPNGGILHAWRLFFAPTTAIFLRFADEA
ncbi:MAG: hypothetical protein OXB99_06070 [Acidimicrobiaceae bacterium]|nr:hypothetical protein [Acidimicrobiaceae bacterium]